MRSMGFRGALIMAAALSPLVAASAAQAQPRPKETPATPANPAPIAAPVKPIGPTKPVAAPPQTAPAAPEAPPQVPDIMAAVNGGLTADQVAARAAATSYQAKVAEENVTSLAAKAEGSWSNFLPRIQLRASYTRLSEFTAPLFTIPGAPPGSGARFPLVFNQWLTQATIAIPISDYFLKINQSYTAALKQEEAARYDVQAARAKSYSDGKIAYFTWLRSRGALVVAQQSLQVAQAHAKDAENQFNVGNASKADVLRAQTAVSAAELSVERAKSGIVITERQIRIATHAKEDEKMEPGEALDGPLTPPPGDVRALVSQAHATRPEIKSIDKNAISARKLADATNANKYPSLSGFGDVTYANPNQRRFPVTQDWFPTWALGAQVTWSPNDLIAGGPAVQDIEARAAALDAQKTVIRDGIELEVTQAYQAVLEADTAIQTTTRQLESAQEAYRVARELFNAGRGTSTTLIDAENSLAQTRFEHLNAKVDARLARIRLDHAIGRDVR